MILLERAFPVACPQNAFQSLLFFKFQLAFCFKFSMVLSPPETFKNDLCGLAFFNRPMVTSSFCSL